MTFDLMLLAAAVGLAFTVEASLGFGATVVTVALGALLFPLDVLLPAFVPVNVALSAYLGLRYRRHVRWDLLGRRVLPFMALGLPAGMLIFARFASEGLRQAFGVFVVALSAMELVRLFRPAATTMLSPAVERVVLLAGGVVHGAFATGGPLAVYVSGRVLEDKAEFRATLSVLWLLLNAVLLTNFAVGGKVDAHTLGLGAMLVPSLLTGLTLGEWAHRRIPLHVFRIVVFALLLAVGAVLAVRS